MGLYAWLESYTLSVSVSIDIVDLIVSMGQKIETGIRNHG